MQYLCSGELLLWILWFSLCECTVDREFLNQSLVITFCFRLSDPGLYLYSEEYNILICWLNRGNIIDLYKYNDHAILGPEEIPRSNY